MVKQELKEVSIFFVATIVCSFFVFWGPIAYFKIPTVSFATGGMGPLWAIMLFIIGGFVPSLLGITLTGFFEGKEGIRELLRSSVRIRIGYKWYAFMLMIVTYYAASLIILNSALIARFDYSQLWLQLPILLPLLILGPVSEEYGWRGFAIKRMLRITNPNVTSVVIGLIWALWHLPLFYIAGSSQLELNIPFLPFLLTVTSSSFVYTFVYLRTKQSVFSAIFLHWIYTYALEVVNNGIERSSLYNWLEFVPAVVLGIVFFLILRKEKAPNQGVNCTTTDEPSPITLGEYDL